MKPLLFGLKKQLNLDSVIPLSPFFTLPLTISKILTRSEIGSRFKDEKRIAGDLLWKASH